MSKWHDEYLIDIYEMARGGYNNRQIGQTLDITRGTWKNWLKKHPAIKYALQKGRDFQRETGVRDLKKYIMGRLPDSLKATWKYVLRMEDDGTRTASSLEKLETMLEGSGKQGRQILFLEALIATGFNVSRACRMVNIKRGTFNSWKENDLAFREMIEESFDAKVDFFEEALFARASSGDTQAIKIGLEAIARDRGYGKGQDVTHRVEGRMEHLHAHFGLEDLDLSMETRKDVMRAIRVKEKQLEEDRLKAEAIPTTGRRLEHHED